jgi:D-lactate dehydrogenase
MNIAFFSTHLFEKSYYETENTKHGHHLVFFEDRLTPDTASLCRGYNCVCCFVSDQLNRETIQKLKEAGVTLIALRSAGYDHVDLNTASECGITVVRIPAYSPNSIAEHAVALLMTLNRKTHIAHARVQTFNFSLDGLMGFDVCNKTIGVIGTGRIGGIFARIMKGFGCRVVAYDPIQNVALSEEKIIEYLPLDTLFKEADILSLHTPLVPETRHMINAAAFSQMKPGVILINTARGALIDSKALIEALKSGQVGGAALDVYENEAGIFFHDLSGQPPKDDVLAHLLKFPNVLITSHQAFLTHEALTTMAYTTFQNISDFKNGFQRIYREKNGEQIQCGIGHNIMTKPNPTI